MLSHIFAIQSIKKRYKRLSEKIVVRGFGRCSFLLAVVSDIFIADAVSINGFGTTKSEPHH